MTPDPSPSIERLYDLLAEEATTGLSASQKIELAELRRKWPHLYDLTFEETAAALDAGLFPPTDEMPPDLLRRIEREAPTYLTGGPLASANRDSGRSRLAWSGWVVAATLLIALVVLQRERFGWRLAGRQAGPTIVQSRQQLLADATAKVYRDPAKTANVVWSREAQEGYLEVAGLKPNDPAKTTYQLWIVDAGRPDSAPVDGGTFNVTGDSATVPIAAKLRVFQAAAFAITEEQPGGVVVSKNPKLVVLVPE
jgi:Anti-sigma-K factor rskA